jgi:holliday junction DNA helicase RuvA
VRALAACATFCFMITRIAGVLESVEGLEAVVRQGSAEAGLAYQVLIPTYETERLRARIGKPVVLHTVHYLESQGQGASYIPRLVGFSAAADRRFFELLVANVEGFGPRKALRALAQEPAQIARAILGADAAWLSKLPEIGKKTAEKVILELKSKVAPFLTADEVRGLDTAAAGEPAPSTPMEEAMAALMALGETRADAERKVRLAVGRDRGLKTTDAILAAAVGS